MASDHGRVLTPRLRFDRFGRKAVKSVRNPDGPILALTEFPVRASDRPLRDGQRMQERLLSARDTLWGLAMRARSLVALFVGDSDAARGWQEPLNLDGAFGPTGT